MALLIPARTDTKYFQKLFKYCIALEFIKGRLKFNDGKNTAPFSSIIMHLKVDRYLITNFVPAIITNGAGLQYE